MLDSYPLPDKSTPESRLLAQAAALPLTHTAPSAELTLAIREADPQVQTALFAALYRGRTSAYGLFKPESATPDGKKWARTSSQPLPPDAHAAHLGGAMPWYGVIPIDEANECRFAVLDDDEKKQSDEALTAKAQACVFGDAPLVVIRSRSGGIHYTAFFAEPLPAALVIEFMDAWRRELKYPNGTEIFPKQAAVTVGGTGNWPSLPYHCALTDQPVTRYAVTPAGEVLDLPAFLAFALTRRLTRAAVEEFVREHPDNEKIPAPTDSVMDDDAPTLEEAEELLARLDAATRLSPHDAWLRVGLALFDAFNDTGDASGALELWDKHSQRADNYTPGECAKRWKSFHGELSGNKRKTTFKTLRAWAGEDARLELVERYNKRYAVLKSGGHTIVEFQPWNPGEPIAYHELSRIRIVTANDRVWVKKKSWPAIELWLQHPARAGLERLVFDPGAEPGRVASRSKVPGEFDWNLWRGWAVEPTPAGSCAKILGHLHRVICRGDDAAYAYLLQWLAALVQRPAQPVGTALGLRGDPGSGKTTLAYILKQILGKAALSVSHETHVTGQFNAHHEGIILLDAEEAFFAGDKRAAGVLKHLITSPTIAITRKFVDTFEIPNYVRIIVTSNERWVVPADFEDRRWTVLDISPEHVGDRAYFNALYAEIHGGGAARFLHYLQHEVTVDWDRLRTPFATGALAEQKVHTLDPVLEFLLDLADGATCPGDSAGDGRVAKQALARTFDQWRNSKRRGFGGSDRQFKADVRRHLLDLCPGNKVEHRGREGEQRTHDFLLLPVRVLREGFEKKLGAAQEWSTDPNPKTPSGWYPAPEPGEGYVWP